MDLDGFLPPVVGFLQHDPELMLRRSLHCGLLGRVRSPRLSRGVMTWLGGKAGFIHVGVCFNRETPG